jgi:hypothetical protein
MVVLQHITFVNRIQCFDHYFVRYLQIFSGKSFLKNNVKIIFCINMWLHLGPNRQSFRLKYFEK